MSSVVGGGRGGRVGANGEWAAGADAALSPRPLQLIGSYRTHQECLEGVRELLRQGAGLHEVRVMTSGPQPARGPLSAGRQSHPADGALIGAAAGSFVGLLLGVLDPGASALDTIALGVYSLLFGGIAGGLVDLPLQRLRRRSPAGVHGWDAGADGFHLLLEESRVEPGGQPESSRPSLLL